MDNLQCKHNDTPNVGSRHWEQRIGKELREAYRAMDKRKSM